MILIVNEKPSQQRNFAKALGFSQSKTVPGTYEGTYKGQSYRIAALRGHLYGLAKPSEQVSADKKAQYTSWNPANLPWNPDDIAWKMERREDVSSVISTLKKAAKDCDTIYIGTDDDPTGEGSGLFAEAIFENGLERGHKFARLFFEDESEASIKKAMDKPVLIANLREEGDVRQAWFRNRWDWLSMQWTRIATANGDGKSVLRQGRLKSAMVVIVGDQLKAIKAYKRVPSYQNRFRDNHGVLYTDPDQPVYPRREDVPQIFHDSSVTCDKVETKHTAPPKFMDLATLAARLAPMGINADVVLKTYQNMYEASVVSYPRTEDKKVTAEQFNQLLPLTDKIAAVVNVDPKILTHRQMRKTHVGTGMAHGANRPGLSVPNSLAELSKYGPGAQEIYTLLATNWLATMAEDYEFERQTGHVSDYPTFIGAVNVPKSMGWKMVFDDDSGADPDNSSAGLGTQAKPIVYEDFPKRPATPTMKWLMHQLERRNVGTGATRTSIYADVTNARSKYPLMLDKGGKISLTKYGEMSYCLLPGTHIGNLDMTEHVFSEMAEVKKGTADPDAMLGEVAGLVRDDIETMRTNGAAMRAELGVKQMVGFEKKEKAEGTWNGRKVQFNRVFAGHRFTDEEVANLLAGCQITVSDFKSTKTGKTFAAQAHLADQEYNGHKYVGVQLDFNDVKDPKYYYGKWNDRDIRFKREFRGYRLTDQECEYLLAGTEIPIEHLKARSGKEYGVNVRLADMEYNGHPYVGLDTVSFID